MNANSKFTVRDYFLTSIVFPLQLICELTGSVGSTSCQPPNERATKTTVKGLADGPLTLQLSPAVRREPAAGGTTTREPFHITA